MNTTGERDPDGRCGCDSPCFLHAGMGYVSAVKGCADCHHPADAYPAISDGDAEGGTTDKSESLRLPEDVEDGHPLSSGASFYTGDGA